MSGPGGGEGRGVLLLHEQVRRRGAVARGAFGSTDECRWMACLKVETGTTLGRQVEVRELLWWLALSRTAPSSAGQRLIQVEMGAWWGRESDTWPGQQGEEVFELGQTQ
jgi:hypothetical protein